ncbi:nuclear transport factor 2 family protein [Sediminibacterium sp. KACHI17]|jgi:hypothetical protein|uniref:Nuclear transport factor 2 family protein n=2 Tax=Sediminibacterium sp. KACHI17 TaxID=1751071 RepID=A0AAT9GG67_9BACT
MKVIIMKKYLFLIVLITATTLVKAQSAEDSVKAVINQLFTSMRNADSAGVVNCFSEKNILQTIVRDKDGNMAVKTELVSNFGRSIAGLQKNAADERIQFETVKIDGALASVWTPYKFYFNGNFSHCGVNSFQLLREKNGWKIHYLIDTRRKEPCEK